MRVSLFFAAALVASATATLVPAAHASEILRRQTTVTASGCTSQCTPIENTVTNCGADLSCLCSSSVSSALQACAQCGAKAEPSEASTLQTSLDQYSSACNSGGYKVGSLSASGGGSASTSSKANAANHIQVVGAGFLATALAGLAALL